MRVGSSAPAPKTQKPSSRPKAPAGSKLQVLAGDKSQTLTVAKNAAKVCPTGEAGRIDVTGKASGPADAGDGMQNVWLSTFRFKRADTGKLDHVAGLNVAVPTRPGQSARQTAEMIAARINESKRPYLAVATGTATEATVTIRYTER